jgi:hypothetical protein
MGYVPPPPPGWRDEVSGTPLYKRKWAYRTVTCSNGEEVRWRWYFSKYIVWGSLHSYPPFVDETYGHKDFVENITESEYITRKLAGNL